VRNNEPGYEILSMEDIAERAEVSRGTVYNYFNSKDGLYRRVLTERLGALMTRLEEVIDSEPDPVVNLRHCVVQTFLFFMKYPNLLLLWRRDELRRLSFNGRNGNHEPVADHIVDVRDQLADMMQGVFREGSRTGVFHSLDPTSTAQAVLGAIEGTAASMVGVSVKDKITRKAVENLHIILSEGLLMEPHKVSS
jgi:AcrR family transcriptional regulator